MRDVDIFVFYRSEHMKDDFKNDIRILQQRPFFFLGIACYVVTQQANTQMFPRFRAQATIVAETNISEKVYKKHLFPQRMACARKRGSIFKCF